MTYRIQCVVALNERIVWFKTIGTSMLVAWIGECLSRWQTLRRIRIYPLHPIPWFESWANRNVRPHALTGFGWANQ